MATKSDNLQKNIKTKINSIKKLADDPTGLVDKMFDNQKTDISEANGFVKKQLTGITSKLKGKTDNKKDIFEEIVNVVDGFLGTAKEEPNTQNGFPIQKSKLLNYTKQSADKTIHASKEIILDHVKNVFFGNEGICGGNSALPESTTINISPLEFDFLNQLKINPDSTSGKIMYENPKSNGNKFNRELYDCFNSGSEYVFRTNSGDQLFTIIWNNNEQEYTITTGSDILQIGDFLNDYYSSIEYPDIEYILKTAMLMSIQGDPSEPDLLNQGFNNLDILLKKLFALCGQGTPPNPLKNNTTQFNEDEIDLEKYFDFDDVEGIDIDDEDARKRKVLKFRDCNNFEVPINPIHIENFVYSDKNINDNVDSTLLNTANDVTDGDNSMFLLSLINGFILKLPKALISSILSPKMLFPIIVVYKLMIHDILNGVDTVLKYMKIFAKLFFDLIKAIFWKFISEFWALAKKDLLMFISKVAVKILSNKLKRYKTIILSLIALLTKLLEMIETTSCDEIFGAILSTIESALNSPGKIPVPGLLLSLSSSLPGYSSDRAYMNVMEKMGAANINTGPIYGTENKLPSIIKSILDGHSEEIDSNSYVEICLLPSVLPATGAQATIGPGILKGAGKLF